MKTSRFTINGMTGKSTLMHVVAGFLAIGLVSQAHANSFSIKPINFVSSPGYSITATGTIDTTGNTSTINDWNLTVTTAEQLAHYTKAKLNAVARRLNERPRKTLNYQTPAERFAQSVASTG